MLIRAIYDVKGIDMGTGLVRYKAEVDFDGRELTRGYLDKQDLDAIMKVGERARMIVEGFDGLWIKNFGLDDKLGRLELKDKFFLDESLKDRKQQTCFLVILKFC